MTKDQKILLSVPFAFITYLGVAYYFGIPDNVFQLIGQIFLGLGFLLYLDQVSKWFSNVNNRRPRIDYLLKEGFINLIYKDGEVTGVDVSKSPWRVIVIHSNSTFYVWYADQPNRRIVLHREEEVDEL